MTETRFLRRTVLAFLAAVVLAVAGPVAVRAQDAPAVEVRFLDAAAAAAAIVDESAEPYFSLLQPAEMVAKTGAALAAKTLAEQRDECRARYRAAVREFTGDERKQIEKCARAVSAALAERYPLFARTPWSFVKLSDRIEGGFPHTRGAHVVVPEGWAGAFVELSAAGFDPLATGLAGTLVHEQCHVIQRARPALFEDLYVKEWGFVRAKGIAAGPWLEKVQIVNPDGVDVGWVFPEKDAKGTTWWQPLVTLREGANPPRMGLDFVLLGVEVERKGTSWTPKLAADGKPVTRPLHDLAGYRAAFGKVGENFHPNETFAVLFSWLAAADGLTGSDDGAGAAAAPELAKLRTWCAKAFAASAAAKEPAPR